LIRVVLDVIDDPTLVESTVLKVAGKGSGTESSVVLSMCQLRK